MAVPASPAAAIPHGQANPADSAGRMAPTANAIGQREVERAELMRGVSPRVVVMPEDQQRHGNRELGNGQSGQSCPLD